MPYLTINIPNDNILEKIIWLLEHFKTDGVEIVLQEDLEDLKSLSKTRLEKSIPFNEYSKR